MKTSTSLILSAGLVLWLAGCGESPGSSGAGAPDTEQPADGTHTHADGSTHDDHAPEPPPAAGHEHDEKSLGTAMVGDMEVEFAQGHGAVAAGKEGHLVVKLPDSGKGAAIVRAWIGTEDRTLSRVGKGDYASSHDDYDIHATAPDPLPANVMWWVEVQMPDGTKVVGSVKPITE